MRVAGGWNDTSSAAAVEKSWNSFETNDKFVELDITTLSNSRVSQRILKFLPGQLERGIPVCPVLRVYRGFSKSHKKPEAIPTNTIH